METALSLLHLTFDFDYLIRDIFYPHVGQENHTESKPFRFGVRVNNRFSWINRNNWEIDIKYCKDTLVTRVVLFNKELELKLDC